MSTSLDIVQASKNLVFFKVSTLNKGKKLKLPEAGHPNEVRRTNDSNYCLFHIMVHHHTCRCNILKDKIQTLIEVGVLTLKPEYKSVIAQPLSQKENGSNSLYFQKAMGYIPSMAKAMGLKPVQN